MKNRTDIPRRVKVSIIAFLAVLFLSLGLARYAQAQGQLTLADFDSTGLDTDMLALIQTGSGTSGAFTVLYQNGVGSLLDGELGMGSANSVIGSIWWRGGTVNDVRVSNGSDLNLQTYFGSGGAGADLTLRVQTSTGSGSSSGKTGTGADVARFTMDADAQTILNGLSSGDRLIVALTRPGAPPAQVTGVTATAVSDTSIAVSWDAAARADSYRVEWGATSATDTGNATTAGVSYTIENLTANTVYFVRVTATRTSVPDGTPSAEASASTQYPPPAQVTGLNVTAAGHDRITASWSPVPDADGYTVEWDDDASFGSPSSGTSTTNSHLITGLQEETAYHVRVRATRTGAADGPASSAVSATTGLQPPAQVTGLSAAALSDTEIRLNWSLAIRAGGYRVEWGTTSGTYTGSVSTGELTYTVSSLAPLSRYFFRVTATRPGADDGLPSAEARATTNPAPAPGQVTGVSATALSDSEIQAEWTAADNATAYVVQWDTDAAFPMPDSADTLGTGVIIERLRAETEYFVRVKGTRLGAHDGPWSSADSATTLEPRLNVWIARLPGGAIGGQLGLTLLAGAVSGYRFRGMKSPQREAAITGAMSFGALILPFFGHGNNFWIIGVAILVLLGSVATIFLARR